MGLAVAWRWQSKMFGGVNWVTLFKSIGTLRTWGWKVLLEPVNERL